MSIYKDCDIRGVYGEELFDEDAKQIGRAVGTLLAGRDVVVCGDVRLSTGTLKDALTQGLLECGARVVDIGVAPTPVAYFAKSAHGLGTYGLVIVTASHNPARYNGIKLMLGDEPVRPETLQRIKTIVERKEFHFQEGGYRRAQILEAYQTFLHTLLPHGGKRVVLDCGNGTACLNAPELFRSFGYEVVELFCEADGSFPNRDPNPAVYTNLSALCEKVKETGADFGAAFDGDGDRVVLVDDSGAVVIGEKTLVLLAREAAAQGAVSVVYDQKSSSIVRREVERLGGEAIMERSGHVFIKETFLKRHCALAGEISGHFFFQELGYDDGTYAALRVGHLLRQTELPLSQLAQALPDTLITPDIRVAVPYAEQDGVLAKVRAEFFDCPISALDGVRVELPGGWLLVRKSVTEQAMTIRIEAAEEHLMEHLMGRLRACLPPGLF